MKVKRTHTVYVERDDKEVELVIHYIYYSASRGACDSYGLPLEPDIPAEVEILKVTQAGEERDYTEEEAEQWAETILCSDIEGDIEAERADIARGEH